MKRSYSVKGRIVELDVDEDVVAVRFKESVPNSARVEATSGPRFSDYAGRLELSHENFAILNLQGADAKAERFSTATTQLVDDAAVERVAQVFKSGDKRLLATERLIVGFKPQASSVQEVLSKYNLETVEEFGENERVVKTRPDIDPIDVVNEIGQEENVDYAEPDFVIIGTHVARRPATMPEGGGIRGASMAQPTDPLLKDQYAIFITESDLAWRNAAGSPDVRIAILDEGVDTRHPDLQGAVVGMYDATDDDPWQQPKGWDAHGTACAGLSAAIHWNGEGIMGVGGGCSLLAVRIAYSERPRGDWVTTNNWIRRAIDWCRANGADVLSNSWGGGAYNQSIVNAFERVRTHGRNGRGSVIVVAAGNESGAVDFPGFLPDVLTVSASNEYDEFKTRTSQDGEHWWGSNFGPEVDVAAPGVHNLTTDIRGQDGYTTTDYTDFNGTSSATPIVAGACGLLLSVAGNLKEDAVRATIRNTADKVGQFPYNGDRNDQMGHGRVNVRRAVEEVLQNQTS